MGHSCSLSKKTDMVRSVDAADTWRYQSPVCTMQRLPCGTAEADAYVIIHTFSLDVFSPAGSAHP